MYKMWRVFFFKKNMRRKHMMNKMTLQMLKRMEEKDQGMWDPPTELKEEEEEM